MVVDHAYDLDIDPVRIPDHIRTELGCGSVHIHAILK
jgi:hypothetical protein